MFVFLDIDGVMVPAKSWATPQNLEDGFPMFKQESINALKELISNSTTVVLTTSHKSRFSIDEWKRIFMKRGIRIENLKCLAPNNDFLKRKDEILRWFAGNNIDDDFIIIDDDKCLNALPNSFRERLILTSSLVGLTSEHVNEVRTIRERELQLA